MRILQFALFCLLAGFVTPGTYAQDTDNTAEVLPAYDRPIDPDRYLVRPGDTLTVTFLSTNLQSLTLSVNSEGSIIDPVVGVVPVGGKTLTETRQSLDNLLREAFASDDMVISVGAPHLVTILVVGAVENPGRYRAATSEHVSAVIARAGGITETGSTRLITLNSDNLTIAVDLDRARFIGDMDADPAVYAGHVITVPPRSNNTVQVIGAVAEPRTVELLPGDNLTTILKLAGGLLPTADTATIRVMRGGEEVDGDVKDGDVIFVPVATDAIADRLVISGEVARPTRIEFTPGSTLESVLASVRLLETANRDRITVFRRAEPDSWGRSTTGRYPIVTGGGSTGLPLQPGDSVFVPRQLGFVQVSGAVTRPGLYPYQRGTIAEDYLIAAGGPVEEEYELTLFDRIAERTRKITPGTVVLDGDEIIVNEKNSE